MAFKPRTCDRYIDDFPRVRANCESMIANGKRCVGGPDHADSPEKRSAALEAELAKVKAERDELGWALDAQNVINKQLTKDFVDLEWLLRDCKASVFWHESNKVFVIDEWKNQAATLGEVIKLTIAARKEGV